MQNTVKMSLKRKTSDGQHSCMYDPVKDLTPEVLLHLPWAICFTV